MTLIGVESLVREIEAEFRHVKAKVVFQAVHAGATLAGGKVDLVAHTTVEGERITFSPKVELELVDGVAVVPPDLQPTDGSFGWEVKVSILTGRYSKVWLKGVPTSTGVVAFGDLPNLDPATLQPTEDVLDAWATVRSETFQAREDTQGLRDETQTLRDQAGTSAGAAGVSATAASTSAGTASTAATTASTAAGEAGSAATAAGTARDGAVAARTGAEAARDQAQAVAGSKGQPNGIGSLDASGKQPETQVPDRLTASSLANTYAPIDGPFEMVPAAQYGDSWGNNAVGTTADLTSAFAFRVASRLRMNALTDRSVSATRSDQIQQRIAATWTAPGRGVVFIADNILNDAFQNRNTVTYKEATRSSYLHLSAVSITGATASNVQYGPGWASGVSSTVGAYADIAFKGDKVAVAARAGTTGGVFRIRDTTGTVRATVTTSGWSDTFDLATLLTGFGAGDHTVRVEVVSGTVTFISTIVPSSSPPLIVHNVPGAMAGTVGANQNAKLPPFRTALAEVAAEFSNVVLVQAGPDWNPSTMLSTDETHLNDAGNYFVANRVIEELRATPFVQGLNRMVIEAAYVAPSPAFTSPAATVPATVTGVTAVTGYQASVSWNTTTDGGATLTGYVVQASTDGTNWADVKTVAWGITSANIDTGLTPGASYTFRVLATNVKGRSAPSTASSAVTAGPVLTVYSADPLTGSGAMGNAQTGGQAWTPFSGVTYQRTVDGAQPTVAVTDRGYLVVNDGQADGAFELVLGTITGTPGLVFRMSSDLSTGYMFWHNGTTWVLSKQTALGARSNIQTAAGTTTAADKLTVVTSGSSIICKVNGTTLITATDASYTGTRHGMYSYSGTTSRFKDWRHTS